MKTVNPTELRNNIFTLLDEVIESGVPIIIKRKGKILRIVPDESNKLSNLVKRDNVVNGDPDDLVDVTWEKELNLDLP